MGVSGSVVLIEASVPPLGLEVEGAGGLARTIARVSGDPPQAGPSPEPSALRTPTGVGLAGVIIALAALLLAVVSGPPYLSSDGVNGWIVVYAAGLFTALLAIPFALERRLRATHPDRDSRWDRTVPVWGAISVAVLVVGALAGAAGGFAGDSLAGTAGLLAAVEAGLVTIGLLFVLLSG